MARHLMERKRRIGAAAILPVLFLVAGVLVVAVPLALRLYNDWRNARAVSAMSSSAQQMDEGLRAGLLANAHAYNDVLAGVDPAEDEVAEGLTGDQVVPYESQLDAGSAAIAWIEIPKIGLKLPIYRGTGTEALAAGVGHLQESSLPVGGTSTHCVLTGHSGLATSRMFDEIRALDVGDTLVVHTLGEALAYKVYGTEVVWPDEVDSLAIVPDEDLVTLVTCTPYGVNDHRLLVHARRTELPAAHDGDSRDAGEAAPWAWLLLMAVVIVVGIALGWVLWRRRRRKTIDGVLGT